MADDVKEKKDGFSPKDFSTIAQFVVDEYNSRKDEKHRQDLEKDWKEIDRQLRMEPDNRRREGSNGAIDPFKAWMPALELPLQSQTLEILTADARRMMDPDSGPWFAAHAALTDRYLDRVDFQSLVSGDENEVPSIINQDNADKLVQGWLENFHKQYDFWGNIDLLNGEAFKYGMGIGRTRNVTKRVFIDTAKGVTKETIRMPVLFPRSIKNTYLDDSQHGTMNEGQFIGPSTIYFTKQKLNDIQLAANAGSNDPEDEDGGYMPKMFKGIEPDDDGDVEIVEYEGDIILPGKKAIFIPGAIVTVVISSKPKVIRFRLRKHPFSTYTQFPYHRENIDTPYGSSPLMKGAPIQQAASGSFNDLLAAGILNVQPPVSYDSSDPVFAQNGGPQIFPKALWATMGDIKPHQIGEPGLLLQVYLALLTQYADVTGVNAPRLGAQTRSHTTATAKVVETERGVIRTVDYVKSTLDGALSEVLNKEFVMGRAVMKGRRDTVFLEPYGGFADITHDALPDEAVFQVFGSGGPAEQQAQSDKRFASMQQALQLEVTKQQGGLGGRQMDIDAVQEELLREGGWVDTTPFFKPELPTPPEPIGGAGAGIITEGVNG